MSSYTRKIINATITLADGQGTFASNGANQVTLTGLRVVAEIDKAGGISMGTARVRIYGMRQSDMNQLTQLAFHPLQVKNNTISLEAGDAETGLSNAYFGTIVAAWGEYQSSPDVPLYIEAMTGYFGAVDPYAPTSILGGGDVASAMQILAKQLGVAFEMDPQNPVNVQIANMYLPGSALDQVRALAKMANIDYYLDDQTLAICKKGFARATAGQIPLISKDTGLVGYPSFDKMGVSFETIYNPAVVFGGLVQIQSEIVPACGQWRMVSVAQHLESEKPGGAWFTRGWCTDNALTVAP